MTLRNDDLLIPQGTTWAARWPVYGPDKTLADLTGWSVRSQVRLKYQRDTILHEWSTTLGNAIASANGYVEVRLEPAESSAWTWLHTTAVYDVELTDPDGNVIRITQGEITISPEITK